MESFCYSVAHDLRAPLRVITGYGKMLMKTAANKLDASEQDNISVMTLNARRMGKLIDDLLDFSRLGKAALVKSPVNMTAMVKEILAEVRTEDKNMHAEVIVGEMPSASGDPALIKQVWVNLISNAIKYSRKKEKPVVEIGAISHNGQTVYYIKDNGAGFDMEHSGKLFSVFQRLHKVTEYEGTGVGLALVHRIITKHGGKVWAEGKVESGATFYFKLNQQKQS